MSVKKSAPWCHPTFLPPQYQEPDEGDPLTALWEEVKATWEKAMEKKAWKLAIGMAVREDSTVMLSPGQL